VDPAGSECCNRIRNEDCHPEQCEGSKVCLSDIIAATAGTKVPRSARDDTFSGEQD
jgi:hypothetical protein